MTNEAPQAAAPEAETWTDNETTFTLKPAEHELLAEREGVQGRIAVDGTKPTAPYEVSVIDGGGTEFSDVYDTPQLAYEALIEQMVQVVSEKADMAKCQGEAWERFHSFLLLNIIDPPLPPDHYLSRPRSRR